VGLATSVPELFDGDEPSELCVRCNTPLTDDPDIGTPIYDSVVAELGDPAERIETFDDTLARLDAHIASVLRKAKQFRSANVSNASIRPDDSNENIDCNQ
jgi:hypothetical protein